MAQWSSASLVIEGLLIPDSLAALCFVLERQVILCLVLVQPNILVCPNMTEILLTGT